MQKKILTKLNKLVNKLTNPLDKHWLTVTELSNYIKLSPSSIRRKVRNNDIPHSRTGKGSKSKILFNRKQIDLWLLTGKKRPNKRERQRMKDFINE